MSFRIPVLILFWSTLVAISTGQWLVVAAAFITTLAALHYLEA